MNWFMHSLANYANFSGRARRREYNWFQGITSTVLIGLVLAFLYNLLASLGPRGAVIGSMAPALISALLLTVFALGIAVPSWAVLIRRLHDVGMSGWLSLIVFVPGCGFLFLVVIGLIDGTPGSNQFGPNPKGK